MFDLRMFHLDIPQNKNIKTAIPLGRAWNGAFSEQRKQDIRENLNYRQFIEG